MYRPTLDSKDKGGALAGVIAIHAGLLFAFLNLSGTIDIRDTQEAMRVFDVLDPPPPPIEEPPPPPPPQAQRERPRENEGAAAPANIRSQATPVVAPRPPIVLPVPLPIATSETPNDGAAPTQGAADRPGAGTGAGGSGTGTGSGGSGSGTGAGGGGGIAAGPAVQRSLTGRDYPDEVRRRWRRGMRVFVAIRVQPDGRATDCRVDRSSGDPLIDQWTCRLVETAARFRPAVTASGQPVAAWYGYIQADTGVLERR